MNKTRFLYAWERSYPHIIAMVITITLTCISFNPIKSKQIDSLVEGIDCSKNIYQKQLDMD